HETTLKEEVRCPNKTWTAFDPRVRSTLGSIGVEAWRASVSLNLSKISLIYAFCPREIVLASRSLVNSTPSNQLMLPLLTISKYFESCDFRSADRLIELVIMVKLSVAHATMVYSASDTI